MNCLSPTIWIILVLCVIKTTSITQSADKSATADTTETDPLSLATNTSLNDRFRRLIPYMTFYVPSSSDYNLPINQAYNYMPIGNQNPQSYQPVKQLIKVAQHQQQQTPQLQYHHQYQHPHHQPQQQQQQQPQQQHQPVKTVLINNSPINYEYTQRHPSPAITYHTPNRHQSNKIYAVEVQKPIPSPHPPHQYNNNLKYQPYPQSYKKILTPFSPTNKLPGYFTPMSYLANNQDQQYDLQEDEPVQKNVQLIQRPAYVQQPKQNYIIVKTTPAPNHIFYQDKRTPISHILYNEKPAPAVTSNVQYHHEETESYKQVKPISGEYNTVRTPLQLQKEYPQYAPHGNVQYHHEESQKPTPHEYNTVRTPLVLHKETYPEYTPITGTTISPPIVVSTPNPKYQQAAVYKKQPTYRPAPTKPQPPRQHLTENTQVQPTTLSTHQPASPPNLQSSQNYYNPYPQYNKPTIKHHHQNPSPRPPTRLYVASTTPPPPPPQREDPSAFGSTSLSELLKKLQDSNHLPKTLTPDNIDNSIKTLVKILNNLKESQKVHTVPPQSYQETDYDYNNGDDNGRDPGYPPHSGLGTPAPGPTSGKPGIDYPALAEIPETSFSCKEQRYKGFFGDPETNCQVWHYCDLNGGKASFLCPNGTIFSQVALTCDWWFNVKCSTTAQLYVLNERLYKYILPFTPKFPEDYSGPLVDKYLAMKFQEMEDKMKNQRQKGKEVVKQQDNENDLNGNTLEENDERYNQNQPHPIQYVTTEVALTSQAPTTVALPPVPKTNVESERVEVIEIKPDGSTGHLTPNRDYE